MNITLPLSIIVITFNNYEELLTTLESIPDQYKNSIFIVNGGSCNKTKKLLEGDQYKGITEEDFGISDAFNKGVRLSSGEWIHFLNSGDQLLSDRIYFESFIAKRTVSFIYSNIIFNDLNVGKIVIKPSYKSSYCLARGIPFPHPGLIVRRDVFKAIGGFDTSCKIGMDFNFVCKMLLNNFKGEYIPTESVLMDGTGVSSNNEVNALKENLETIRSLGLLDYKSLVIFKYSFLKAYIKKYSKNNFLGKVIKFTRRIFYKTLS